MKCTLILVMIQYLRAGTCLVCVTVFFSIYASNIHIHPVDLDATERVRPTGAEPIETLRKQWAKDAFQQFDIYACEHLFYPFLIMVTLGRPEFAVLSAYFYESYSAFQFYILDVDDPYFIRTSDALIQDPVQALCATWIAYLLFFPEKTIPDWSTVLLVVVLFSLERDWIPFGLESIASVNYSTFPTTNAYISTIPILLFFVILYAIIIQNDTWRSICKRILVGYSLIFISQILGCVSRKSQQPLPSNLLWFMLLGSIASLVFPSDRGNGSEQSRSSITLNPLNGNSVV